MSESPELQTVKKCVQQLETAFRGLDRRLVQFLNQNGFITESIQERLLNPVSALTEEQKAGELVKWIKNRIEQDCTSFHVLVDRLKQDGKHYQPVVDTLEAEYEAHGGRSRDSQSNSRNITGAGSGERHQDSDESEH